MSHEVGTEGNLTYTGFQGTGKYINLTKDLSWVNSRNHQHTDNDGHVVGYWCDVTIVSETAANWSIITAPNTWKMRNSFRKFHAYRDHMFKEAGVSKSEMGRYGRTIRPYLEPGMYTTTVDAGAPVVYDENDVLVPLGCTDNEREWTYSSLASNPGWLEYESIDDTQTGTTIGLADEWKLTICGENAVQEETGARVQSYFTAGMIHSYNLDRMEVVTPDTNEVIVGPNNPLAALRFQGPASGEVIDITEDQELEAPPYDIRDDGNSIATLLSELGRTNSATLSFLRLKNVFIPAGIFQLGSNVSISADGALVHVDVKGWSYCKDLA